MITIQNDVNTVTRQFLTANVKISIAVVRVLHLKITKAYVGIKHTTIIYVGVLSTVPRRKKRKYYPQHIVNSVEMR